ncbi:type VII secretion target [Kitasatospora sp. GAS204B]|uniref:type VII secretion target n=1 Tax=unclassified Kitasatospora TaxID=2633591 RepID=UPI002476C829|nr:type VII secretion target [Kitasatospora sp. GAS204B]MDH6115958.1 uncharacterized protein YukE [Kitasatospora sp. GAS204B]
MNDIQVHPDGVRGTARAVRAISDQASPTADHLLDDSLTVAQAQPAWQSSSALTTCATNWQARLNDIVGQLRAYSDQLNQSANSYDAADAEAGRRFQQAVADLNAS